MSGGAFDYPHHEADDLIRKLDEMEKHTDDSDRYDREVTDQLAALRETLEAQKELLRLLDKAAASDISPQQVNDYAHDQ